MSYNVYNTYTVHKMCYKLIRQTFSNQYKCFPIDYIQYMRNGLTMGPSMPCSPLIPTGPTGPCPQTKNISRASIS